MNRYIDADFVANRLREVLHRPKDDLPADLDTAMACLVYAISILRFAPTADVAPVVHAHWIDTTDKPFGLTSEPFVCSWCGGTSSKMSFYCCDCGAKMDEEVEA